MNWLVSALKYADLISGGLGIAASIVLGYPAFRSIRSKKYWEGGQKIDRDQKNNASNQMHVGRMKERLTSMQLGGSRETLLCSLTGFTLLALSFVFLLIAALDRHSGL
jgi:hypothetical protein